MGHRKSKRSSKSKKEVAKEPEVEQEPEQEGETPLQDPVFIDDDEEQAEKPKEEEQEEPQAVEEASKPEESQENEQKEENIHNQEEVEEKAEAEEDSDEEPKLVNPKTKIAQSIPPEIFEKMKKIPSLAFPHPALLQRQLAIKIKIEDGEVKKLPFIKKRHFSPEEDRIILDNYKEKGTNWAEIAKLCGNGRTAKNCRDRYRDSLAPNVDHSPWSEEDKKLLIKLVEKYGPNWSSLSNFFPGRKGTNIKNTYITYIKNKGNDPFKFLADLSNKNTKFTEIPTTIIEIEKIRQKFKK